MSLDPAFALPTLSGPLEVPPPIRFIITPEKFRGDAQCGTPDVASYGGTSTSAVISDPEFSFNYGRARRG